VAAVLVTVIRGLAVVVTGVTVLIGAGLVEVVFFMKGLTATGFTELVVEFDP